MAAEDLRLWGIGTTRTLRPLWMLAELGVDFELKPIQPRTGETLTAEFLRLNPRHKIPVLQHRGAVLTESAAIVRYLADSFPLPPGFHAPRDALGRAKLDEWCYFIMSELDGHTLYIIRRHVQLSHLYGEAPSAVAAAREYFLEHVQAVTPRVAAAGRYLFGEEFGIADILLTTCLTWAVDYGIALPAPLGDYVARVTSRPAYQRARAQNTPPSC